MVKVLFNDQRGWVKNDYISISMHPWSKVQLRDAKFLMAKSIMVVPKGARVEVMKDGASCINGYAP